MNFNCLFFTSTDELEAEEFPAPKAHVDIPLIETDWFVSGAWDELPTNDATPALHDDELGPESDCLAESLYELLVAQKRGPVLSASTKPL